MREEVAGSHESPRLLTSTYWLDQMEKSLLITKVLRTNGSSSILESIQLLCPELQAGPLDS